MRDFLDGLAGTPGADALTLYLPPDTPAAELDNALKELPEPPDVLAQLAKNAAGTKTGAVIFWSPAGKFTVLPPFPVTEKYVSRSLDTGRLRSMLGHDYLIALVLVRLGAFAIGVFSGEKRLTSKVGTGLVHGRHRQGGSSAHRFERHRDKQIESFLTRVCRHSREQLESYVKSLDYLVYGGARTTILLLQKQCPFVGRLETPALPPLLDIPDPRQAVLETAVSRVWSSTVMEWRDD
jgi:peptide subunit release factor 1 (eRF1)